MKTLLYVVFSAINLQIILSLARGASKKIYPANWHLSESRDAQRLQVVKARALPVFLINRLVCQDLPHVRVLEPWNQYAFFYIKISTCPGVIQQVQNLIQDGTSEFFGPSYPHVSQHDSWVPQATQSNTAEPDPLATNELSAFELFWTQELGLAIIQPSEHFPATTADHSYMHYPGQTSTAQQDEQSVRITFMLYIFVFENLRYLRRYRFPTGTLPGHAQAVHNQGNINVTVIFFPLLISLIAV